MNNLKIDPENEMPIDELLAFKNSIEDKTNDPIISIIEKEK